MAVVSLTVGLVHDYDFPPLLLFEILNRAFVFLSLCTRPEGAQVFALTRFGILLSGIEAILAGF